MTTRPLSTQPKTKFQFARDRAILAVKATRAQFIEQGNHGGAEALRKDIHALGYITDEKLWAGLTDWAKDEATEALMGQYVDRLLAATKMLNAGSVREGHLAVTPTLVEARLYEGDDVAAVRPATACSWVTSPYGK